MATASIEPLWMTSFESVVATAKPNLRAALAADTPAPDETSCRLAPASLKAGISTADA